MTQVDQQQLLLREAEMEDLEDIVSLTITSFFGKLGTDFGFNNNRATAFYRISEEQRKDVAQSMAASSKDICLVACDGRPIVGFVRLKVNQMEIDNLCVDATMRRQGLACMLMEELDEAVTLQLENTPISSSLVVDSDNKGALSFYESCGWERDGRAFLSSRYTISWWKGLEIEVCEQQKLSRAIGKGNPEHNQQEQHHQ